MLVSTSSAKRARPAKANKVRSERQWLISLTRTKLVFVVTAACAVRSAAPLSARLDVFRSSKHIYAQIIDDVAGVTLCSASTMEKGFEGFGGNIEAANKVGKMIAEKALEKGIKVVVFDRGGFVYHGRVKALAEGAREGGLEL